MTKPLLFAFIILISTSCTKMQVVKEPHPSPSPSPSPLPLPLPSPLQTSLLQRTHLSTPNEQELPLQKNDPSTKYVTISRSEYVNKLEGFWLGQCMANWTGLITEMDKVEAPFYTDSDWGSADQKNIWNNYTDHSNTINYYFVQKGKPWGSDDDTDIEYMYQHLLDIHDTSILSAEQIKDGWLTHIYSNDDAPYSKLTGERENYLWVSNERAYELMQKGTLPPDTSEPKYNTHFNMIDAQLTTEIFGLFAPTRPDIALKMAHLPIRTTAKDDAEWISEFYVTMHALASVTDMNKTQREHIFWLAEQARTRLPKESYSAKMYDFIKHSYDTNPDKQDWEKTRDEIYQRYQKSSNDGYQYRESFDAGINFAASLVSLFYGEGDIVKTIRIGSLAGWDSDNPTATWGGLLGFILGKDGVEKAFNKYNLSNTYWIHRTRRNFPDHTPDIEGEDDFLLMAKRGISIIDRVVTKEMSGTVDIKNDAWIIPK